LATIKLLALSVGFEARYIVSFFENAGQLPSYAGRYIGVIARDAAMPALAGHQGQRRLLPDPA
jgi:hypothetical protein